MCILIQLSSYGGFLSYQVKSFGLPSEGMVLLDKRPEIKLTVSFKTFFFFVFQAIPIPCFFLLDNCGKYCTLLYICYILILMQGQQMKIVYVDPSNPLPDRQYYGRVQLVEVRNGNGMGFHFLPCSTFTGNI